MRMDGFVEMTFELGLVGMIGKGDRSAFVPGLCKKYGGIYFLGTGGASALISKQVKSCEVVAWEDLGTESVKKLEVEKLRLIVGIDSQGRVFQDREIAKYRIKEQRTTLRKNTLRASSFAHCSLLIAHYSLLIAP
jgi:fumarate hydratase subunit beta